MAQLKDLIVNGDARVIGKLYADQTLPDGVFHLANVSGTAAVTTSPYSSSKWQTTVNDPRITSLYSGLTISLKIPVAGHSTYGTMLDVNGLGYHPVVYNVNSNISTRYSVGGTIILTYNATQTANGYDATASATSYTGCWQLEDYDYDSTNIYQLRDNGAQLIIDSSAGNLYRYELIFMNKSGKGVPYNNTSNATTTYTKTLNSAAFDPFLPIYYYSSTTTVNAGSGAAASTLYTHVNFDCRYSMNIQSDGTAGSTALTAHAPVYIVAAYNETTGTATLVNNTSATSYLDRSSIVQALPASNLSGKILIYLGRAYSKYQIELATNHPVYKWDSTNSIWALFGGTGSGGSSGVTSITAGAGLSGGTITTTGTIKVDLKSETASTLEAASMGSTTGRQYAVGLDKNGDLSVNIPWEQNVNTTYTFAGGTNKFTVTPSDGLAQDITVTPDISNNITGSGTRTSGYLAKFSATNTITNGPQLGSGTTTYLRNDATWQNPQNVFVGSSAPSDSNYEVWIDTNGVADRTSIIDTVYPVGSIYISIDSTNPGITFGVGTWVAFGMGRTLLGCGTPEANTNNGHGTITNAQLSWNFGINDKGGGYTHTLVTSEMPKHNHSTSSDGGHNHDAYFMEVRWANSYTGTKSLARPTSSGGSSAQITTSTGTHNHTITQTGGDGAHNNMMPYITVYMWKRTA